MAENGYFKANSDGTIDVVATEVEAEKITCSGTITAPFIKGVGIGVVGTYVADGAIALTDSMSLLDGSSATVAATLADGTNAQFMYIKAIDVSNAVTVVPANLRDGTTITFTPANEYIVLGFDGTNWNVFGGNAAIT